jgi:hypothetical protein
MLRIGDIFARRHFFLLTGTGCLRAMYYTNVRGIWQRSCNPVTSKAGARPLEGQLSLQINECLGAISFENAFSSAVGETTAFAPD